MFNYKHILASLLVSGAILGPAVSFAADNDVVSAAEAAPDNLSRANQDSLDSASAAQREDWETQTVLAAKAFREDPSLLNQFNLATGYQNTGRSVLAIPLYQDVAARGQFIRTRPVYNIANRPPGRLMLPTLADEAARRLELIAGRPAPLGR